MVSLRFAHLQRLWWNYMDPVGIFETSLHFLGNRELSRNPIEIGTRSSISIKINGIYSIPMQFCFFMWSGWSWASQKHQYSYRNIKVSSTGPPRDHKTTKMCTFQEFSWNFLKWWGFHGTSWNFTGFLVEVLKVGDCRHRRGIHGA